MALTPGSRLGPYEVTALLGEGGMGQVYRATDTNLKRQVAIKVLPASLAGDADRLARFQRSRSACRAQSSEHRPDPRPDSGDAFLAPDQVVFVDMGRSWRAGWTSPAGR